MGFFDGLIGGVLGLAGTHQSNSANLRLQNDAQEFEAEQGQIGRDWSERMFGQQTAFNSAEAAKTRDFNAAQSAITRQFDSTQGGIARRFAAGQAATARAYETRMANTSYQRAVGDLQKAGLNPMLSYLNHGAPTPSSPAPSVGAVSGPSASGPAASVGGAGSPTVGRAHVMPMQSYATAATTALEYAKGTEEVKNLQEQNSLLKAQTHATETESIKNLSSAGQMDQGVKESISRIDKMKDEVNELRASVREKDSRVELNHVLMGLERMRTDVEHGRIGLMEAEKNLALVRTRLESADVPGREVRGRAWQSVEDVIDKSSPDVDVAKHLSRHGWDKTTHSAKALWDTGKAMFKDYFNVD